MILSEGALCRLAASSDSIDTFDAAWTSRKPVQAGLGFSTEKFFRWALERDSKALSTITSDARTLDSAAPLDEHEERHLAQAVRFTRCPIALSRLEQAHRARVVSIAASYQGKQISWPTLVTEARRAFFDAVTSFNYDSSNTLARWIDVSLRTHLDRLAARCRESGENAERPGSVTAYTYGSGAA